MIFRLFANVPPEGWVLLCSVEVPAPHHAVEQARVLIKPDERNLRMSLVRDGDPIPPEDVTGVYLDQLP